MKSIRLYAIAAIILIMSGGFVLYVSFNSRPNRQFLRTYKGYRTLEQPDASRLNEWDKQLSDFYSTAKDAFTAQDKGAATKHLTAMNAVIQAQETYYADMTKFYAKESVMLPGLKQDAGRLTGKRRRLAVEIIKDETELMKLGRELNTGSVKEMGLWRKIGDNFSRFMNAKISGSDFLNRENDIAGQIDALKKSQETPGLSAEKLLNKINADWKALEPLL